jgi:hypothetical protein
LRTGEWDVIGAMTLGTANAVIADHAISDALSFQIEHRGLLDTEPSTLSGRMDAPRLVDGSGTSATVEIPIAEGEVASGTRKASLAGVVLSVSGTLDSVMEAERVTGFGLSEYAPEAGRRQAAVAIARAPELPEDLAPVVEAALASWLKREGATLLWPLLPRCPGFAKTQEDWRYAGGKAVLQERASRDGATLAIGLASRAYPDDDSVLIDADLIAGSADLAVVCSDVVSRYFREALNRVFQEDSHRRSRRTPTGAGIVQYGIQELHVRDEALEVQASCVITVRVPIMGDQMLRETVTMRYSVVFDHAAQEMQVKKTRHLVRDRTVTDTFVLTFLRVIFGVEIVEGTDLFQGTSELSFPLHGDGRARSLGAAYPLDFVPDEGGLRGAMFFRRLAK